MIDKRHTGIKDSMGEEIREWDILFNLAWGDLWVVRLDEEYSKQFNGDMFQANLQNECNVAIQLSRICKSTIIVGNIAVAMQMGEDEANDES